LLRGAAHRRDIALSPYATCLQFHGMATVGLPQLLSAALSQRRMKAQHVREPVMLSSNDAAISGYESSNLIQIVTRR
jgi:hypothetical protein